MCILLIIIGAQAANFTMTDQSFTIMINEEQMILNISQSDQANFTTSEINPACQLKQSNLDTSTFQTQLVEPQTLENNDIESSVFPFKQTITRMVLITNGIAILTSDLKLFLIKFDMKNILSSNQNIISHISEANLQYKVTLQDIPSLLYVESSDQLIILFARQGFHISMDFSSTLLLQNIPELRIREQRKASLLVSQYIFSNVGSLGLDIYKINGDKINFIGSYQNITYPDYIVPLRIKDFVVRQESQNQYYLYIIDANYQFIVLEAKLILGKFKLLPKISCLNKNITGAYLIDTYDGVDVFLVLKSARRTIISKFKVDLQNNICNLEDKLIMRSRIIEIDAQENYIILSGYNHQQILYHDKWHKNKYLVFTHGGLIDFDLVTSLQAPVFFGVTRNLLFVTKFNINPLRVVCHAIDCKCNLILLENQIDSVEHYQLAYDYLNNTFIQNIEVLIKQKPNSSLYLLLGIIGSLSLSISFILIIVYSLRSFKTQIEQLEGEIKQLEGLASINTPAVRLKVKGQISAVHTERRNEILSNAQSGQQEN